LTVMGAFEPKKIDHVPAEILIVSCHCQTLSVVVRCGATTSNCRFLGCASLWKVTDR
jgi:hypothetical protein